MLKLMIPRDMFDWIESNRGKRSRAYFIIETLYKVMEDKSFDITE